MGIGWVPSRDGKIPDQENSHEHASLAVGTRAIKSDPRATRIRVPQKLTKKTRKERDGQEDDV